LASALVGQETIKIDEKRRWTAKTERLSELIVRRAFLTMVLQMDLRLASTGLSQSQIKVWDSKKRFGSYTNPREHDHQSNHLIVEISNTMKP
jgi:hypothetical protein